MEFSGPRSLKSVSAYQVKRISDIPGHFAMFSSLNTMTYERITTLGMILAKDSLKKESLAYLLIRSRKRASDTFLSDRGLCPL